MTTPETSKATSASATGDPGPIPANLKREPPKQYEFHRFADLFPILDPSSTLRAGARDINY
jgi:hypothetical protein